MRPELARVIFRVGERLSGTAIRSNAEKLDQSQWRSSEELSSLSLRRFQSVLREAYENVPFYRRALEAVGIHPSDVRTLEDVPAIPVLTKSQFQAAGTDLVSRGRTGPWTLASTSGSSGRPLAIRVDSTARAWFLAAQLRGAAWYGIGYGDPTARFWGLPLQRSSRLRERCKDLLLNRRRLSVFGMSEASMERFYRTCRAFRPRLLYGYSASLAQFAEFVNTRGLGGSLSSVRAVVATSETLYDHQRAVIGRAFSVPVASEYGCTEVGIIAYQCPSGSLHVASENVLVEVLRDGQPVPHGEVGTLVVTGLHNRTTPFIRYELGDYGALESGLCPCGRGLPVMSPVVGRCIDRLRTRDGSYLPPHLFDYIINAVNTRGGGVKAFRVVQETLDDFRVEVVAGERFERRALPYLGAELRRHLGEEARMDYRRVDEISREPSGKLRSFVPLTDAATEAAGQALVDACRG